MINQDSGKFKEFEQNFWQYYLRLENEMIFTMRYVEFNTVNFKTFSLEYLKLYQSVCSEIDVVGKEIAGYMDTEFKPEDKSNSVLKWWYVIQYWIQGDDKGVEFYKKFSLKPWKDFEVEYVQSKKGYRYPRTKQFPKKSVPTWWSNYNDVKHHRATEYAKDGHTNFEKANLENLANAFAGLYILEKEFLKSLGNKLEVEMLDKSKLFEQEQKMVAMTDDEVGDIIKNYN